MVILSDNLTKEEVMTMKKIILGTVVALTTIVLLAGCSSSRADNSSSSANILQLMKECYRLPACWWSRGQTRRWRHPVVNKRSESSENGPETCWHRLTGVHFECARRTFCADFFAQSYAVGQWWKFSLKKRPLWRCPCHTNSAFNWTGWSVRGSRQKLDY